MLEKYILNTFKLISIIIISFCLAILWLLLGESGRYGLMLYSEIPSMYLSIISATLILTSELVIWLHESKIRDKFFKNSRF